jgi:hypothetical protein
MPQLLPSRSQPLEDRLTTLFTDLVPLRIRHHPGNVEGFVRNPRLSRVGSEMNRTIVGNDCAVHWPTVSVVA